MSDKQTSRIRRATKTRAQIARQGKARLCVHKTAQHTYAYLIDANPSKTLATASTLQKAIRASLKSTSNIAAAEAVGKAIAEKAKALKIKDVAFDRSGFKYHGRIKALADGARAGGLQF